MATPMTADRFAEIERILADLGPFDAANWRDEITENGDLLLHLPEQFRCYHTMNFGSVEDSTATLLEFLGAAPHAIRELLAEVKLWRTLVNGGAA